ncbi:tyrosine--tRNA ligase [bacterium]|nr:tyrosine--tRNA ligase [bacterium]
MTGDIHDLKTLEQKLLSPEPDLRHLTAEEQFERIMSKVADHPEPVVTREDLLERLRRSQKTGTPLKVKLGIDPTGPEIHIGHAVPLLNLRLFQRMGHKIQLVIGDFTGAIGDPSGRTEARPALTDEQMRRNMSTYEEQASRIVDLRSPDIERHFNSEWMNQLDMKQWVRILKEVSASELLQREDIRLRLKEGRGLSMAELEYALFMGYDSVVLVPDIEVGGVDQYLNMHMCRQMMSNAGQKPEIIIAYNLLAGTTGVRDEAGRLLKMSKSYGNYIPVTVAPEEMFGKVMSIPDEVMWVWFRELTEITPDQLQWLKEAVETGAIHPKDAKRVLAKVVVGTFNHFDRESIERANADFDEKFGKQAVLVPDSTLVVEIDPREPLLSALAGETGETKSHVRRLAQQKGIHILKGEQYVPMTMDQLLSPSGDSTPCIVRVGKRKYFDLRPSTTGE